MGDPALKTDEHFTYRDYATWPDDERWELIDGEAMAMAAPSAAHQRVLLKLVRTFADYFDDKPCEVLFAPFDVLFPEGDESDDDVDTVVQPDLMVFCDGGKVLEKYGRGAPDLVIEILSPSTSKWDQNNKWRRYERAGVREYWVVDPKGRWICVYSLAASGKFDERGDLYEPLTPRGPVPSKIFEGLTVDTLKLFAEVNPSA
jgi:Uma2 family endonuclease